jgi:hypothetical protein
MRKDRIFEHESEDLRVSVHDDTKARISLGLFAKGCGQMSIWEVRRLRDSLSEWLGEIVCVANDTDLKHVRLSRIEAQLVTAINASRVAKKVHSVSETTEAINYLGKALVQKSEGDTP